LTVDSIVTTVTADVGGVIMDQLEMSQEPITTGDLCKNCTYAVEKGEPSMGPAFHKFFCAYEENLVEVGDYQQGIKTTYAPLASEINDSGSCADFLQKT